MIRLSGAFLLRERAAYAPPDLKVLAHSYHLAQGDKVTNFRSTPTRFRHIYLTRKFQKNEAAKGGNNEACPVQTQFQRHE